jgi:hypothetical protein
MGFYLIHINDFFGTIIVSFQVVKLLISTSAVQKTFNIKLKIFYHRLRLEKRTKIFLVRFLFLWLWAFVKRHRATRLTKHQTLHNGR